MDFSTLLFDVTDGLARVTINRPDKLNALSADVVHELAIAFKRVAEDNDVGAAILTGSGDRAFAAGADIEGLSKLGPAQALQTARDGQALTLLIENMGKPVVAAVNGFALGGGCELAMACTFRTASTKAKFGQPEVNLGIIAGYGGTQRLPRLVGRGRALELLLTGGMISADEAHRIGLVNHVVPHEELLPATEDIARTMLEKGPLALRYTLEAVASGADEPIERALRTEAALFGALFGTADAREGMTAFLEKRKATFTGE